MLIAQQTIGRNFRLTRRARANVFAPNLVLDKMGK